MDYEAILKAATPMVLGAMALVKMYMEMRSAQQQRDAGIRGVDRYAKETGNGERVKALIADEVDKVGATQKFDKAIVKAVK